MRIYCFSDTHGFHDQINPPENIEIAIFAGDESNSRNPLENIIETKSFIEWYKDFPAKHKIFIAGNHSIAIERKLIQKEDFMINNITILNHESIEIRGIKLFGSPFTPSFGEGWAYNRRRDRLHKYWEEIPEDTDILITHGPAKGILDLSFDREGNLEYCGCSALRKRIDKIQPKYHIFGHLHDSKGVTNHGLRNIGTKTTFINASMVEDGRFDKGIVHKGIIIDI